MLAATSEQPRMFLAEVEPDVKFSDLYGYDLLNGDRMCGKRAHITLRRPRVASPEGSRSSASFGRVFRPERDEAWP
jgi:hypothetical protein